WIFSTRLNINKEIVFLIFQLSFAYIFWIWSHWIVLTRCEHTIYFIFRIYFMCNFCSNRTSHQLMMGGCIFHLFFIFALFKDYPGSHKRSMYMNLTFGTT